MLKKITAILLGSMMLLGLCACSGDNSSTADTSGDTSAVVSKDDASADAETSTDGEASADAETSKDGETSEEGETSTDEPSNSSDYVDKAGYEQFQKVAAVDKSLAERGFKDKGANKDYKPLNYDKMKAIWISQFDFDTVYCNGSKQRSESSFKRVVEKAYDNLLTLGFNTVIVQVRPNADSFYPSAYYPASHYVNGSYGKYFKYDPIKIMIDLAHEKGLSFHAWINPMRGMSPENLEKVNNAYPMKDWTSVANRAKCAAYLFRKDADGLNYLNIAYEDVRANIINGAAEIVRNYDVDGVHMDDYFYWGEEPNFDIRAFNIAKSQNATLTLKQFRFKNLNTLVSGIYSAIKEENKNVLFGISPAGNLDKMATTYYADVETWLSQDGYLDYIMPQIYFGMEHATWGFADTYQRWSAVTTNPKIKFTFGVTAGKIVSANRDNEGDQYAGTGAMEWIENDDVFKKCFEYGTKQSNFAGYAIFCYQYLFDPLTGETNEWTKEEIKNCKPYLTNIIKGEVIKY